MRVLYFLISATLFFYSSFSFGTDPHGNDCVTCTHKEAPGKPTVGNKEKLKSELIAIANKDIPDFVPIEIDRLDATLRGNCQGMKIREGMSIDKAIDICAKMQKVADDICAKVFKNEITDFTFKEFFSESVKNPTEEAFKVLGSSSCRNEVGGIRRSFLGWVFFWPSASKRNFFMSLYKASKTNPKLKEYASHLFKGPVTYFENIDGKDHAGTYKDFDTFYSDYLVRYKDHYDDPLRMRIELVLKNLRKP